MGKCCCGFLLLVFFIVPIGYLAFVEIRKIADREKIECFVGHMKNEVEESFSAVNVFTGDEIECTNSIDNTVNNYLENVGGDLHEDQKKFLCVLAKLKFQESYTNQILLAEVLEYTKFSWKFWQYFERKHRLDQVRLKLMLNEDLAIEMCSSAKENPQQFDINSSTTQRVVSTTQKVVSTTQKVVSTTQTTVPIIVTTTKVLETTTLFRDDDEGSGDDDDNVTPDINSMETTTQAKLEKITLKSPADILEEGSGQYDNEYNDYNEYDDEDLRGKRQIPSQLVKKSKYIHNDDEDFIFQS